MLKRVSIEKNRQTYNDGAWYGNKKIFYLKKIWILDLYSRKVKSMMCKLLNFFHCLFVL